MVNRISTSGKYDLLISDMQKNLANYNRLTQQLAANSKILEITDDPIGAVNILNTNRQLGQIDTFSQNAELAMSELSTLDDLFSLAEGYLSNAWDKAVQANNQTYGKTSLEALKVEIDEITKTMVDLANTEYNNNYIFGGANTQITPYEITENGDIVYKGTPQDNPDYKRQTEVSDGVFEIINTTGDRVFGLYQAEVEAGKGVYTDANGNRVYEKTDAATGVVTYEYANGNRYTDDVADLSDGAEEVATGVMGALKKLSNSIQKVVDGIDAGDDTIVQEGYKEMNLTLDMFANSHTDMTEQQTKFGGVYNRLEMTTSTLETNNQNLTSYLSQIKDIDMTEAITEWMQAQYAYEASMKVSSSSMGMSLLNYL